MPTLVNLVQNISLLLALTFLYGYIYPRLEQLSQRRRSVLNGLLFGLFAVIGMTQPIQIAPGLFYDARTVVICIAGLYGGPLSALIAALMVAFYRLSLGGIGVSGALASVTIAATIGIFARRYFQIKQKRPEVRWLIALGVVLALQGTVWGMLLSHINFSLINTTLPQNLILYPLGLLLLGELLNNQQRSLEMERALQDNERRFRGIFDSTFEYMCLLTPGGTVIEANQAVLNLARAQAVDLIGQPLAGDIWRQVSPDVPARLKEAILQAARGEFVRYELTFAPVNNETTTIDLSLKPLRDDQNNVVMLIAEGRDVTSIKELERQKVDLVLERERARLLKKFISDVSHDLRTPLSVMRLNLELLRRSNDPAKQAQRIETLSAQEQHLTRLLTDMVVMLTLDDEQTAFQFKRIDLNFVAQLVFDRNHSVAQRKQQKLTFNRPSEPLLIEADQVELERALSKLIDNALNYTPKGGSITLSTRQQDGCALVEIQDTGVGISEADLANIFQRFYRADQARSMDTGGTGLGLPIAQKIVEAHKGEIRVESKVDAGTTFRVLLPLAVASQGSDSDTHRALPLIASTR